MCSIESVVETIAVAVVLLAIIAGFVIIVITKE